VVQNRTCTIWRLSFAVSHLDPLYASLAFFRGPGCDILSPPSLLSPPRQLPDHTLILFFSFVSRFFTHPNHGFVHTRFFSHLFGAAPVSSRISFSGTSRRDTVYQKLFWSPSIPPDFFSPVALGFNLSSLPKVGRPCMREQSFPIGGRLSFSNSPISVFHPPPRLSRHLCFFFFHPTLVFARPRGPVFFLVFFYLWGLGHHPCD